MKRLNSFIRARRIFFSLVFACLCAMPALSQTVEPGAENGVFSPEIIRIGFLLTLLAFIPAIFISMTSFIRIAIVLSMVRHAFGMPETPPNQVLVSLALFLTLFVMAPTISEVNTKAFQPLMAGDLSVEAALQEGAQPLKTFMLSQVRDEDLATMYRISKTPLPGSAADVDLMMLAPAFILNELRVAFTIGFVILLPFLLIDLLVSSILLSLGMMMVPPTTIALPIKILMFVVIDGWSLVIQGLLGGFPMTQSAPAKSGLELVQKIENVEASLWRRLKFSNDIDCRQKLFALHQDMARKIAVKQFYNRPSYGLCKQDFQQLAYQGLLQSIDRFNPTTGDTIFSIRADADTRRYYGWSKCFERGSSSVFA